MAEAELQVLSAGHYQLNGELSFYNVFQLQQRGIGIFEAQGDVAIDLSGISRADSAGVALLVEWKRQLLRQNRQLQLEQPPKQIQAIVRLCSLTQILALDDD